MAKSKINHIDRYINVAFPPKYTILEEPSNIEAAEFIRKNWRRYVIVIFSFSRVTYEGRAASKLDYNDHLIILKPDGTVLVHGQSKREPINWQPPGCILTAYVNANRLVIKSKRIKPKEVIIIECEKVYVIVAMSTKKGFFELELPESWLVEYVIRNPNVIEEGFKPIAREYATKYGFIDLLGRDKHGNLVVCEFKRRNAEIQHVAQLAFYVDTLSKSLKTKVRGILLAPKFSSKVLSALKEKGLEYRVLDLTKIREEHKSKR